MKIAKYKNSYKWNWIIRAGEFELLGKAWLKPLEFYEWKMNAKCEKKNSSMI